MFKCTSRWGSCLPRLASFVSSFYIIINNNIHCATIIAICYFSSGRTILFINRKYFYSNNWIKVHPSYIDKKIYSSSIDTMELLFRFLFYYNCIAVKRSKCIFLVWENYSIFSHWICVPKYQYIMFIASEMDALVLSFHSLSLSFSLINSNKFYDNIFCGLRKNKTN